jgi:F-type H+-transporting ATPase subunit b
MADVEARLARLQADVQLLKDEAMKESEAEKARGRAETAAALAKIRAHAEQEIEAAAKSARLELKRYAAQLAISLAEQKIRARMNPAAQDTLFQGFLRNLDGNARAQVR